MQGLELQAMLDAGVHFGHLRRKWNPKMRPYIFMESKGIHIIDVNKTNESLLQSAAALKSIAKAGKKILFVATKKQAKDVVAAAAKSVGMPFVTDRWLGGMLTNFATIRKSIKKMQNIERTLQETTAGLTKKERLVLTREQEKLNRVLGGIEQLNRLPAALFMVDIGHEHLALLEAKSLNISTFGIVDTNCDPTTVDFAIPGNDDASKSVALITNFIAQAINDGLKEREADKNAGIATEEDTSEELVVRDRTNRERDRNKNNNNRNNNNNNDRRRTIGGPDTRRPNDKPITPVSE